jgi:HEAT repeat protein
MDIASVLADKQTKAKSKVELLSRMLLDEKLDLADLIRVAKGSKGSQKGTCIEAIQFATKVKPEIATLECLTFASDSLLDKAPRVQWESAKVIAEIAHLYPKKLDVAICNLLTNSESSSTVVRWSAALALGEIVKLRTKHNRGLVPAIDAILRRENDNAIKKIYQAAVTDVGKC